MEIILEEILSEHILKKTKKGVGNCLKSFRCKSNCQINNEEKIDKLNQSKTELIELMKIIKRNSESDLNTELSAGI